MDRKTETQLRQELADVWALLDAERAVRDAAVAAERERWVVACNAISGDLRNHDVVRMTAAKCLDAGLRGPNVRAKRGQTAAQGVEDGTK